MTSGSWHLTGVEGVIIGTALYRGAITLPDAIGAAEG